VWGDRGDQRQDCGRESESNKKYSETFARVRSLVADLDPDGTIALGAPIDEYDDLVASITSQVLNGQDVGTLGPRDDSDRATRFVDGLRALQREMT
jgi:hypothetical protein